MKNTLLDIRKISLGYSSLSGNKTSGNSKLLDEFDLTVSEGEITALIGGNGTGKTTLFNLISGFLTPDEGEIIFHYGKHVNLENLKAYKRERLGIGRLFQDNHIFAELTVMENLLIADSVFFGESPIESIFRRNKIEEIEKSREMKAKTALLTCFGNQSNIINQKNEFAKNLSFGQQRLLGLARLFMGNYKLLLLDEPTSGINPALFPKISNIIKKFKENDVTVFFIEHNMNFVREVAERCTFINAGKIEFDGTPDLVLGSEMVRMNYLGY